MNKEKIIIVAREYLRNEIELKNFNDPIDTEDMIELVNYLEDYYTPANPEESLIHFNILQRSNDCNYWLDWDFGYRCIFY